MASPQARATVHKRCAERLRRSRPLFLLAFGVGLAATPNNAAHAQQMLRSPEAVAQCVCLERAMQTASAELEVRRQMYEEKRRQFADLEAEIARRRPQINTADNEQVDAFRRLIEERDRQMVALRDTVTPGYADRVEQYNGRVASYNASCQGRTLDADVLYSVRQTLVCPAP